MEILIYGNRYNYILIYKIKLVINSYYEVDVRLSFMFKLLANIIVHLRSLGLGKTGGAFLLNG